MSEVGRAKSRVALAEKKSKRAPGVASAAAVQEARRDLAAAKLEKFIAEVLATAPELSESQKEALSAIFQGASS